MIKSKNLTTCLLMLVAMLFAACSNSQKPKDITLTFDVKNPTASEVVLVYNRTINPVALDKQGHASYTLKGRDALYASLFYGQEQKLIYMEKGDQAKISFDGNNFSHTFKWEGNKAAAIDYLNNVSLSRVEDDAYALPMKEFAQKVEDKEQGSLKLLKAAKLNNAGNFEKMEEGRIKYAYASSLLMYPVGHVFATQDTAYRPDEAYFDLIRKYFVEDADWADIQEYRDFMTEAAHQLDAPNRDLKEMYPKCVAEMRYIADHIQNDKVKQMLLNEIAGNYIVQFGIKNITDMESLYHTYVKDSVLVADYQTKYDAWDLSSPGKPSPEIDAVDIKGNKHTLKEFQGNYVYIDLWATWCGPCKQELPHLKALAKKMEGKHIVFLGLSIDQDKAKWEEEVKKGELPGTQLYIGHRSAFQQAYGIDGIPRFILLDREGKIVNNNMTRPSSEDTEKILSALDGI